MDCASGGEEHIGWTERLAGVATNEFTRARGDEVDLVSRVRLLWIRAARGLDLHQ